MELTPFERAQRNKLIHTKRVEMTIKITELVQKLEECETYLATARMLEGDDHLAEMFTPQLISTVEEEVEVITKALAAIADAWEELGGVSA
tara:strand:- start:984 stop:1256 length:273 start_codon:yes stop_codon:yes gene_type:complete